MATEFANPYNFVSTSDSDTRARHRPLSDVKDANGDLLSGEVSCVLENKTPMLVGGKRRDGQGGQNRQDRQDRQKDHKIVEFFQLDHEKAPMVPASTLKGVMRSAYEALTNSCMLFHNPNDFEGKRTTESSYDVEVGIVEYLPQAGHPGRIRLADRYLALPDVVEAAGFFVTDRRRMEELEFTTHQVWCDVFTVENTEDTAVPIRRVRQMSTKKNGACNTEARLHITGAIPTPDLPVSREALEEYAGTPQEGQTVSYRCKMGDRGFVVDALFAGNNKVFSGTLDRDRKGNWVVRRTKKHVVAVPRDAANTIELSKDEYDRYLHVQRHGQREKKHRLDLRPGDVVFFRVGEGGAVRLTRASLGRESFEKSVSGLMTKAEQPCTHVNKDKANHDDWELCPACQLFGTVEDRKSAGRRTNQAYAAAGRVRFTHARPLDWSENLRREWFSEETPLQILSSPKPSCTPFYLRAATLGNTQLWDDGELPFEYDDRARLRGRKFYLNNPAAGLDSFRREGNVKDNQNVSARLLNPNRRFAFTVQFEGLTPQELGGLLYTLSLEGCLHGVGAGKPLGMGACAVTVERLRLHGAEWHRTLDLARRWREEAPEGFVNDFKKLRASQEKVDDFEAIPAVRDLKAIRGLRANGTPLIMYPKKYHEYKERGQEVRKPVGFKWFMDHATLNLSARGRAPQFLPLPEDIARKPLKTALRYEELQELLPERSGGGQRGGQYGGQRGPGGYPDRHAPQGPPRGGRGPAGRDDRRQDSPPALPAKRTGKTVDCVALDEITKKGKRVFMIVGGDPSKDKGCLLDEGAIGDPSLLEPGARLRLMIHSDSPGGIQFKPPRD